MSHAIELFEYCKVCIYFTLYTLFERILTIEIKNTYIADIPMRENMLKHFDSIFGKSSGASGTSDTSYVSK